MSNEQAMSKKVLVLGVGPIPPENPPRLHAPGLRLWSLARFLTRKGYEVLVGMVGFGGQCDEKEDEKREARGKKKEPTTDGSSAVTEADRGQDAVGQRPLASADAPPTVLEDVACYRLPYDIKSVAERVREIVARHRPRCVVSTTDFMNLAAVAAQVPVPVWLDFMGQPMPERQLLADIFGSDEGLIGQWQYVLPSLLGGDRFSVCSNRQRYMLLGELGAVGRLNRHTTSENLVEVLLPFHLFERKFEHTRDVLRGICVRGMDFVVLWSGGFNTWTDVQTLFEGLDRAIAQHRRIVFVSTGGAIPGHDDRTYGRFCQLVEKSSYKGRYKLCGWVPTEDVPNYYLESNVALNVDRWSIEGQVGYRTRILDWIMAGLPVVTTALCELSQELADRDLVTTFRIGDPKDLSIRLIGLATDCAKAIERTAQAREYLLSKLDPDVALAPLAAWVAEPRSASDLPPPTERSKLPAFCCAENSLAHLHRATLTSVPKEKRFWARLFGSST